MRPFKVVHHQASGLATARIHYAMRKRAAKTVMHPHTDKLLRDKNHQEFQADCGGDLRRADVH
jgi:hypothetical protein